jgi:hypothetical protein
LADPPIRIAQSDQDILAIHRFMITHAAAEMAKAEVDTLIYRRTIQETVTDGALRAEILGYAPAGRVITFHCPNEA